MTTGFRLTTGELSDIEVLREAAASVDPNRVRCPRCMEGPGEECIDHYDVPGRESGIYGGWRNSRTRHGRPHPEREAAAEGVGLYLHDLADLRATLRAAVSR